MSIPPPNDPDQPTRPLPPAEPRAVERERVVDQVVEPEFDPRFALASIEDSLRSLRTGLVLLGLVSVAALLLGGYALYRAEDADRTDRDDGSRARVSTLQDRVDELEKDLRQRTRGAADSGDVNQVEEALDAKADAEDVQSLEQAVSDLQEQQGEQQSGADPETAQAIEDLGQRLEELEQRVEEQEQQAP